MPVKQIILGRDDIAALLPLRPLNVQKYTAGKALVIAGSRGMTGAAVLAARAALRSGAGLVTLAVPEGLAELVDAQTPEILTLPLPGRRALARGAIDVLRSCMRKYDCVLLGPGLGAGRQTLRLNVDILQFISNCQPGIRLVLDADGLKALPLLQRSRSRMRLVITPHTGELAALLGSSSVAVHRNPYAAARQAAVKYNAVVVLKDADHTYIVENKNRYFLNNNGNPGMATAGSGDVLAGIITGLWTSTAGMTALRAAAAGPYVHGLAGCLAAQAYSVDGLIAGDILAQIPAALRLLKGE